MTTVGWIQDEESTRGGRQFTIKNFRDAKPPDIELIDIDLEKPVDCDAYVIHSSLVPKNLPLFPKGLRPGQNKPRPVIMYVHQWDAWSFGATSVIYQSPMHASMHKFGKKYILPPSIVPGDFKWNEEEKADIYANLWLGTFCPETGADIAVRIAEAEKVETHFYGYNIPQGGTELSKLVGQAPHEGVGELYKRYQKLVFYPRAPQPFSRVVAEALLAGMEVEISGQIGLESFDEPVEKVLEMALSSADKFWEIVGEHL